MSTHTSAGQLPGEVAGDLTVVLAAALAASSNGLTICDAFLPDLPLIYVNPAFERISGYPKSELLGRNARFPQGPEIEPDAVAVLRAGLRTGQEVRATLSNERPDGSRWWNEMNLVPLRDAGGVVTHWVATQNDVTARVEAEKQVVYLAHHDALTGLANRRHLTEHLSVEIRRAERSRTSIALLYLDLDEFKQVNDNYGHAAGDQLLVTVGERLRAHVRAGDLVVRQGGDEFLVVLSGLPAALPHAEREAREIADKLRVEVRVPFDLGSRARRLTMGVSIGGSLWPHHAADSGQMLAQADAALYLVKAQGRDRTLLHGHLADPGGSGTPLADRACPEQEPAPCVPAIARPRSGLAEHVDVQRAVGLQILRDHG